MPVVARLFSQNLYDRFSEREATTLFPVPKRLKQEIRELIDRAVFHGGKVGMEEVAQHTRRLRPVHENMHLPIMTWTAGQREFTPLLLGLDHLLPPARLRKRKEIDWVVIEEPEMGLHPQAITVVLLPNLERVTDELPPRLVFLRPRARLRAGPAGADGAPVRARARADLAPGGGRPVQAVRPAGDPAAQAGRREALGPPPRGRKTRSDLGRVTDWLHFGSSQTSMQIRLTAVGESLFLMAASRADVLEGLAGLGVVFTCPLPTRGPRRAEGGAAARREPQAPVDTATSRGRPTTGCRKTAASRIATPT